MTPSETKRNHLKRDGRRAGLVLAVIAIAGIASAFAGQEMTKEWKLRVTAKSAGVHREQDSKSPVIGWIEQGKELTSTIYDGEWYMITIRTGEGGMVLPGYISRFDVQVIEEKVDRGPDYFDGSTEAAQRKGITLKISGGYCLFSGGDIDAGAIGMYNQVVATARASGFAIVRNDPKAFHAGPEGGLDLVYRLNSRFGIGLGGSYLNAKGQSAVQFAENSVNFQTTWNVAAVKAYGIRLEAYYDVSLLPWLGLSVHGGPAFYHADYDYSRDYFTTTFEESDAQTAKADTLGFHGGLGLSFGLNSQIAILLEAQVRYARFGDVKGSEKLETSTPATFTNTTLTTGSLYYVEGGAYPKLAILADGAASGLNARKAVLDISGVVLAAGVVIRF
jgi:hypothetical protein